jgi:hypothetical protein
MKQALATLLTGAFIVAAGHISTIVAAQQAKATGTKGTAKPAAKAAVVPPPVAVEVIAVDSKANTITVRDIAAVPATKPVEVKLPVPANAAGQKLSDTKAGDKVDVTCAIKPTVHPTAGVPIVLTDCVRVIKIEPKS